MPRRNADPFVEDANVRPARRETLWFLQMLALRYRGHRCTESSFIKPWYFAGSLDLEIGATIVLTDGLVFGRGADASVRVASNGVARKHARIEKRGDELWIVDLRTTNGTTLNGVPLDAHRLSVGDVIALADLFDFEVVEV